MSGSRGFTLVVRSTANRVPQSTHCITRFRSWITSFFPRSSSSHRSTAKAYSNHISPPIGHLLNTLSPPGADFPYRKRSRRLLDTFWTPRGVFEPKPAHPPAPMQGNVPCGTCQALRKSTQHNRTWSHACHTQLFAPSMSATARLNSQTDATRRREESE